MSDSDPYANQPKESGPTTSGSKGSSHVFKKLNKNQLLSIATSLDKAVMIYSKKVNELCTSTAKTVNLVEFKDGIRKELDALNKKSKYIQVEEFTTKLEDTDASDDEEFEEGQGSKLKELIMELKEVKEKLTASKDHQSEEDKENMERLVENIDKTQDLCN